MKIPIVDQKDIVVGFKERTDIDYSKDIFRTASLWITNPRGEILLAQRKLTKKVDPGKWAEAVGGTVEGDDTYEQTIIREAEEELGLTVTSLTSGPKQFITTPCSYFVQWFSAVVDKPIANFVIQQEEVEQIAWVPLKQLRRELKETPEKYIEAMGEIVGLVER
ncbi:MAG TPA: NUDIX domain-containing protein [Candidatus Saccharimonas sp.]|nr:NUDIX domain-containing protein [Candidatus Saccharimonas sp.]